MKNEISLISKIADTMNNGINAGGNNTYIGNFRVQQNDSSTSPHQMMNQMTDGFKPFYKKYVCVMDYVIFFMIDLYNSS